MAKGRSTIKIIFGILCVAAGAAGLALALALDRDEDLPAGGDLPAATWPALSGLVIVLGLGLVVAGARKGSRAEEFHVERLASKDSQDDEPEGGESGIGEPGAEASPATEPAGPSRWPVNRIVRMSLALAIALGAVAITAASYDEDNEAVQRCETTTEAVGELADEGRVVSTRSCRPIAATDLIVVFVVIALLLLPDVTMLGPDDRPGYGTRRLDDEAGTAFGNARAARDVVASLESDVFALKAQLDHQVPAQLEQIVRSRDRRAYIAHRWHERGPGYLWPGEDDYQWARRLVERSQAGFDLTDDEFVRFVSLTSLSTGSGADNERVPLAAAVAELDTTLESDGSSSGTEA